MMSEDAEKAEMAIRYLSWYYAQSQETRESIAFIETEDEDEGSVYDIEQQCWVLLKSYFGVSPRRDST